MRKTAFLLAVALLFSSCERDDNNNGGTEGGTEFAEWVDLGLPSGLLWAKWNLGATAPEEYGDYYAWGETETKSVYDWSTYKYCNGGQNQLTKYCNHLEYGYNGFTDTLTVLQPMDDVSTAKLGNGAHIPTKEDWLELLDNTTSEWTTMNGVYGRKLTSKTNGNYIYLPAAGRRYGSELRSAGEHGFYWSSSLAANRGADYAFKLDFGSNDQYLDSDAGTRKGGLSVRPVHSSL